MTLAHVVLDTFTSVLAVVMALAFMIEARAHRRTAETNRRIVQGLEDKIVKVVSYYERLLRK